MRTRWSSFLVLGWIAVYGCDCGDVPPVANLDGSEIEDGGVAPDGPTPDNAIITPDGATPDHVTVTPDGGADDIVTVTPDGSTPDNSIITPDGATPDHVTVTPDGATPDHVTVTPDGGTVDTGDETDNGTTTDSGGNHAPEASAGPAVQVLPGEQVVLAGAASDPDADEELTYSWTWVDGSAPAGVEIQDADTLTPTVVVHREEYIAGPTDLSLSIQLEVIDPGGLSDTGSTDVTILDERGPYVALPGGIEVTGYSGTDGPYCGVMAHPCDNIADALVNLAAARSDDPDAYAPLVMVATTEGRHIETGETILLDGDISLECGFDPISWTKADGLWTHTPIRFKSLVGVVISTPGLSLSGCDIQGISKSVSFLSRTAVRVATSDVTVRDNILRGNSVSEDDALMSAGITLVAADRSEVRENDVQGGLALQTVWGIRVVSGGPSVTDNIVTGGTALYASGIWIDNDLGQPDLAEALIERNLATGGEGGDADNQGSAGIVVNSGSPTIRENTAVGGTSRNFNAGLVVGCDSGNPLIDTNSLTGVTTPASALYAVGTFLEGAADLHNNTITGGSAASVTGLTADGDDPDNDLCAPHEFTVISVDNTITGGSGNAVSGVGITDGVTLELSGGSVTGTAPGGSPTTAFGITVGADSSLTASGTAGAPLDIRSGNATASAAGVQTFPGALAISLGSFTTVQSGNVNQGGSNTYGVTGNGVAVRIAGAELRSGSARSVSSALYLTDCSLDLQDSVLRSGNADDLSMGVIVGCPSDVAIDPLDIRIVRSEIRTGRAALTAGIHGSNCRDIVLEENDIEAGAATGTYSLGAIFTDSQVAITDGRVAATSSTDTALGLQFTTTDQSRSLRVDGATIEAGTGGNLSGGIYIGTTTSDCSITDAVVTAGNGGVASSGIGFTGVQTGLSVTRSQFYGGLSRAGSSWGGVFSGGCDGCWVGQNIFAGGDAVRSVGLAYNNRGHHTDVTVIFSNRIWGGAGVATRGLQIEGNAGTQVRVLNNNIHGGDGVSGGMSASVGVFMGPEDGNSMTSSQSVGVIVGNIIDAGDATASFNLYENTDCASGYQAQPVIPLGGRNNDLWPPGSTGLIMDARAGDPCQVNLTTLAEVDGVAPYAYTSPTDRTWSTDPLFANGNNGYRLSSSSPLLEAAPWSSHDGGWWPYDPASGGNPFVDFDGEGRPWPVVTGTPDIGCDEFWPAP